jgi:hypothetical protein
VRVLFHRSATLASVIGIIGAVAALCHCEQRFSANPPSSPAESEARESSSASIDALLAPRAADAGAAVTDDAHALVITLCSSGPQACPAAEADASATATYRVVYGSGRGVIRTREQALTDLYRELRDRTAAGERLVARPHAPGDAGAFVGGSPKNASESGGDALAQSAQRLTDIVDAVGQLTIDVIHESGSGCTLALADVGTPQCLIKGPERPHDSKGRGGLAF